MVQLSKCYKPDYKLITTDKGHGRVESRTYFYYDISSEYVDKRWKESNFQSLFKVTRKISYLKNGIIIKQCEETSYYISNATISISSNSKEYFTAIRNHWSVEVNNHIRDVTLKEDKMKTKNKNITRVLGGIRTLTINILKKLNPKNLIAQIELFQDDFLFLLRTLREINFL